MTKNTTLNKLFDCWYSAYGDCQKGFSKDGIIDEMQFAKEHRRILFVLLEPNTSKEGNYSRNWGRDLRPIFRDTLYGKPLHKHLAQWSTAILDRKSDVRGWSEQDTAQHIRRVAIMNLKKIGGAGTADKVGICLHAWQNREFIQKEVKIIDPTLIVCCGDQAYRLFWCVMKDDPYRQPEDDDMWNSGIVPVIHANHPSLRPKDEDKALMRIIRLTKSGGKTK